MRPLRLIVLLIVLTLSASFAQVGTITGTIVDSLTREPLDFAIILIEHSKVIAYSGRHGEFALTVPPGFYSLQATAMSFVTKVFDSVRVQTGDTTLLAVALAQPSVDSSFWRRSVRELIQRDSLTLWTCETIFPHGIDNSRLDSTTLRFGFKYVDNCGEAVPSVRYYNRLAVQALNERNGVGWQTKLYRLLRVNSLPLIDSR